MADAGIWIAADWGTTHLRVWHMSEDGDVLGEARSDKGMASLAQEEFEPALLDLIEPWLEEDQRKDVIACGMVGARQGWIEADYVAVPSAPPSQGGLTNALCEDQRIRVSIIPGMKQDDPADVMRGEETQIAGFLSLRPEFEGTLCMPGTHTKWVQIGGGEVLRFASSLTGELFALLSSHSVLRHSVSGDGQNLASFKQGAEIAVKSEGKALADIFSIRAEDLLHGQPADAGRGNLSGLLIGSEVAARKDWLEGEVVILGEPGLTNLYGMAIETAGGAAEEVQAMDLTLRGLRSAHDAVRKESRP